tara:strand:+ start:59 stop:301 length:243 start_codon:yes stop_codon:yes gene_type:complete
MKLRFSTFDDFLQEEFFQQADGLFKETFDGRYEGWLEQLDGEEYIELGDKYKDYILEELSPYINFTQGVLDDATNKPTTK